MTVTKRQIPEIIVDGKRLGRHVHHDDRSDAFAVTADGTVASASWTRVIPVLDQGNVGSCTGNATVGVLGTDPFDPTEPAGVVLDEAEALTIYSAAEVIDGDGPYPPNDNGSSGLSVAKAAKNAGLISGYRDIGTVAAAQTVIQTGPFIIGSDWYTSFDTPDANGLVVITPEATVRGGHEYECRGYDATTDLWNLVNSWGLSYGANGEFFYSSTTFAKLLEGSDGDATVFVSLSNPAPVPVPVPVPVPAPTVSFWKRLWAWLFG